MSTTQSFHAADGLFTLEYPRTWESETYEGIPAFYDPLGGAGALQFFAARLTALDPDIATASPFLRGQSLEEKMALFLEEQDIPCPVEDLHVAEIDGQRLIAREYEKEGRFFMAAMFERGHVFVLSLYNAPRPPENAEAAVLGAILRSLRLAD